MRHFYWSDLWPFWIGNVKGRGNRSPFNYLCFYCSCGSLWALQLGDALTNAKGKTHDNGDSTPVLLTENITHARQSASRSQLMRCLFSGSRLMTSMVSANASRTVGRSVHTFTSDSLSFSLRW